MRFRVGALTLFLAGAFLAAPLAADAQQAEDSANQSGMGAWNLTRTRLCRLAPDRLTIPVFLNRQLR